MMMTNLFSIFDPSLTFFSFSWMMIFFVLLFLPVLSWGLGLFSSIFSNFLSFIKVETNYVIKYPMAGVYSFISSILLIIGLYNFLALFPHVFSLTSHMCVTLPFSFSFWVSIVIFGWISSFKHFLSHLIPVGTPLALMSFMVIVEVLSNLIRPLALTFRLTANMMAGHLLMSLVGGALVKFSFVFLVLGSLLQSLLVFMELGVSLIQAYVFSTLLLLYMSETEH